MCDKHCIIEEPDEVKVSRPVLKTNGVGDSLVEFNRCVCKSNDLVAYEDLVVRNMVKNHCLAKSINDASWTQFREWLEYNACKFNRETVAVNPQYTSQKCSNCGAIVKKSLSVRTHICKCGCKLNRDENAALNILNLALQARGGAGGGVTRSGVGVTTLVGETLLEQTLTLSTESPSMRERGVSKQSNLDDTSESILLKRKSAKMFIFNV